MPECARRNQDDQVSAPYWSFDDIDEERQRCGLSKARLCRGAGVSRSTYHRWERGVLTPSSLLIERLWATLARHKSGSKDMRQTELVGFALRGAAALIAIAIGVDPLLAVAAINAGAANDNGGEVRRVRDMAIYVVVAGLGLPHKHVADIANLSKQRVSQIMSQVEDMREGSAYLDKTLDRVLGGLKGEDANDDA